MEPFDGIIRTNTGNDDGAFFLESGSRNGGYISVARPWKGGAAAEEEWFDDRAESSACSRQQRRLYTYGGFTTALIVVVLVLVSSSSSSSSSTRQHSPSKSGIDTSRTEPFAFHAQHPLAGEYHDTIELYIREDISSLSPGAKDTEITTIIESIKTVSDNVNAMNAVTNNTKQWDVTTTRLSTDTQILGHTTHCDTRDKPEDTPFACFGLIESAGTKMTFVIDNTNGQVLSEVDTDAHGHIMKNARTAGGAANPIQTVDNNLLYLPPARDGPVKIGDEWESRFPLQTVGDYVGKTTFVGMTKCDNSASFTSKQNYNDCAVLSSSGKIYMDTKAMDDRFGSMGMDPSMVSIIDGTATQTMHWNDQLAYFSFCETRLNFTIKITVSDNAPSALIPVREKITQTTVLQQQR